MIGPLEIMLVGVVALLVFGPEKLPEMARTVGRTANQLRRMAADLKEEFNAELEDDDEDRPEARHSPTAPGGGVPKPESEGAGDEVEPDDDLRDDVEPDDETDDYLAPDEGPPGDLERQSPLRGDPSTRDSGDESEPDDLSAEANRRSQAVPDRSLDTDE
jgi:sec-independent protein translocase protein TatB